MNVDDPDLFRARIAVVGVGGMGSNLVNRVTNMDLKTADTIAINTDAKHLSIIKASKKVLIGKDITRGLGAGGFPEVAEKAAEISQREIEEALKDYNLVFIAYGAGGGTGGGAAPIVARIAKEQGATVIGFVTYPFRLEKVRTKNADASISKFVKNADATIIIENERLLQYAPNLPFERALEAVDILVATSIKGISDTINLPSLMSIDYSDLAAIVKDSGIAMINVGYGSGDFKVEAAIKSTIAHPLLSADYSDSRGAIVHISGGPSLTISDATRIGEEVTAGLKQNANVIFGARIVPEMQDQIKVTAIITNVKPKIGEFSYTESTKKNTSDRLNDIEVI